MCIFALEMFGLRKRIKFVIVFILVNTPLALFK